MTGRSLTMTDIFYEPIRGGSARSYFRKYYVLESKVDNHSFTSRYALEFHVFYASLSFASRRSARDASGPTRRAKTSLSAARVSAGVDAFRANRVSAP